MKAIVTIMLSLFPPVALPAVTEAEVLAVSGEVNVRRGLDENWQTVAVGDILRDIDTIITGESGSVVLKIRAGAQFRLGANSVIDIADLRQISEREMFLFLTRRKVGRIAPQPADKTLQISNVSVVHGSRHDTSAAEPVAETGADDVSWKELNGARALFEQHYYTNAIIKLHKVEARHPNMADCGLVHYYLGCSFEALSKTGQAQDAYQTAIQESDSGACPAGEWLPEAREKLEHLKN